MEATAATRDALEDGSEEIIDGASSAGDKRPREQQAKEEQNDRPATAVNTAIADAPLNVLSVAKLQRGMLVWLRLCSAQGVALFYFVRVPLRAPLRAPRLVTSAGVSLTRAERLNVLGCGMKSELVRLLSLRLGRHFVLQTRRFARQQLVDACEGELRQGQPIQAVHDGLAAPAAPRRSRLRQRASCKVLRVGGRAKL